MTKPIDLTHVVFGPKAMACSPLERRFAYVLGAGIANNATDAARLAGYADTSSACRVRGFENMRKPYVLEAIEEAARTEFRGLVGSVIQAAKRIIENDQHPDHVKMISSMLSRLGYSERNNVDVTLNAEVHVNHNDAAVEHLRILRDLGVPRDELVKTFGHAGLPRFERLLREREAKQPKLIEHIPDEAPTGTPEPAEKEAIDG